MSSPGLDGSASQYFVTAEEWKVESSFKVILTSPSTYLLLRSASDVFWCHISPATPHTHTHTHTIKSLDRREEADERWLFSLTAERVD